jgi:Tfp pilus assembly protein PilO
MKLKSREKMLLILVGIVIAAVAFLEFYYDPQKRKISALEAEVKTTDLKLAESLILMQGADTVETEVTRLEQELNRLQKKTLKGEEFRAFLRHLAKETDPLQMKIVSLVPQEEKPTLPEGQKGDSAFQYKKVGVQMVIHSTYNKLGDYLKEIGDLPFLINVDHLQIERREETQPFLTVNIGLSMYIITL